MILRVKVNKQLDGKANGIIESCQEIISELCSILEWMDFTWMVSDCEELVGNSGDYWPSYVVHLL